ncbi:MAG: alpha/beta hydrolase [Gammaproteobacteria bacterium]|nr:alpha/beta hydrolase [Gammaproteobacteria bacterium]
MKKSLVVFSHGQESGPWGTKIRAMSDQVRDMGCGAESIDYQGIADPADRVTKLIAACREFDAPIVLVGSSMGGYVATAAASAINAIGLFVLAPAYYMEGFSALTPPSPNIPTVIVHGWHDDIVPVENSIRFAREAGATLHIVDDGHRLAENIDEINVYLQYFINGLTNN